MRSESAKEISGLSAIAAQTMTKNATANSRSSRMRFHSGSGLRVAGRSGAGGVVGLLRAGPGFVRSGGRHGLSSRTVNELTTPSISDCRFWKQSREQRAIARRPCWRRR